MRRPAVVVSDDRFNRSHLSTVTVVAVTSNMKLAQRPGNIALAKGAAGLDRPSVVNLPSSRRSTASVLSLGLAPSRLQPYAGSTTARLRVYTFRPRLEFPLLPRTPSANSLGRRPGTAFGRSQAISADISPTDFRVHWGAVAANCSCAATKVVVRGL